MSTSNTDLQQILLTCEAEPAAPATTKGEVKALLALSAPVTLQLSSQYAIHVISESFIGHQGATSLTAAAIGHTVCMRLWSALVVCVNGTCDADDLRVQWFNVCWSFLVGVSTALDTLGSQAYGTGRPQSVISCCISAIVVLLVLCLPLTAAVMASTLVAQTVFRQTPEEAAVSNHITSNYANCTNANHAAITPCNKQFKL